MSTPSMAGDSTTHTVNGVVLSQEDFDVLPPTSQMEERLKVLLLHAQLQAAAEKHRAEMEALAYRSNPKSTKGCLTENCPYRHVAKA
jgi:hypothetical protein